MTASKANPAAARVVSFTPSKDRVDTSKRRELHVRLSEQVEAGRQYVSALESLSRCRELQLNEAEIMNSLNQALECLIAAVDANDGAVLIMDEDSGDLVFALAHGDAPKDKLLWQRVPAGRGVAHWVATHRRGAIVNSTLNDERFYSGIDIASGFHTRSIVAVPLLDGDRVLGVIEVLNKKDGEFFSLSDQNHLTLMAHLASALMVQLRDRESENTAGE